MAYPVFLNLEDKKVVVVGGGRIAERKVEALLDECSNIVVISRSFTDSIEKYALENTNVSLIRRYFQPCDVEGAFLVFITTSNQQANNEVADICTKKGILFNHSADVNQGNVKNGAQIRFGDLHIMVGSGGNRPGVSKWVKGIVENAIPEDIDQIMVMYDNLREQARDKFSESIDRENFIREQFRDIVDKIDKNKRIEKGVDQLESNHINSDLDDINNKRC